MSKIWSALKLLSKPGKLWLAAGRNGMLRWMSDDKYLSLVFSSETGYKLDLQHPKTYNEKLQWLKINERNSRYTVYADKYSVRRYISEKIGDEYLIRLIAVYKTADEIKWDELPEKFVLKCNHGSGMNIICQDKHRMDVNAAVKKLNYWLSQNPYWGGREWCYKNIPPMIICEEYIGDESGMSPDDYKFMCFNGEPRLIQLHHDRYGKHTLDYYYPDWSKADFKRIDEYTSDEIMSKPERLDEMLDIVERLSADLIYARIDLYNVNGRIFFGEITLYPTGGFSTFQRLSDDELLGSWLKLPCD